MIKRITFLTLLIFSFSAKPSTLYVKPGDNLQDIINSAANDDTLVVGSHAFEAENTAYTDPLCGNCLQAQTEVSASYGFLLKGKSLVIIGESKEESILITNAGYGFFILNSPNSVIKNSNTGAATMIEAEEIDDDDF